MNITARDSSEVNSDERTIGEIVAAGENPFGELDVIIEGTFQQIPPELTKQHREIFKLDMLNMLLPDGTRFGDTMLIDLLNLNYAEKTMDEIAELLVDPEDDEVDFIEDGDAPTPEPDFIDEQADRSPMDHPRVKEALANVSAAMMRSA